MITIQMSPEQVRALANIIRNDVAPFVEAHEMEYKEYLNSTEKTAGEER